LRSSGRPVLPLGSQQAISNQRPRRPHRLAGRRRDDRPGDVDGAVAGSRWLAASPVGERGDLKSATFAPS